MDISETSGKFERRHLRLGWAALHYRPTPRTLLFFFALIVELIASAISAVGFVLNNSAFFLGGTAAWLAWFVVIFLVASPRTDHFLRNHAVWLKRGALAIFVALFLLGMGEMVALVFFPSVFKDIPATPGPRQDLSRNLVAMQSGFRYTDATALCDQAATNLLQLKNPYANSNIVTALESSGGSSDRVTPLRLGAFADQFPYPDNNQLQTVWQKAAANPTQAPLELESRLTYPAGAFLLPAPFMLAGMHDMRIVYFVIVLAALGYAAWLLRREKGLFFLAAALISLEIWNSIADGETGVLAFAFLLLGWALARKFPWQSAVFMGIAMATKQTAWFFLPFYLILVFKTAGARRFWSLTGIIAGVFIAANLPFVAMNAKLWFDSVMAPMTDRMFPLGVGFITLLTSGVIDVRSQLLFASLELLAGVICVAWYWGHAKRYPETGPILAVLPIFFAWRSLWTYFFYVGIIVLASVMLNENTPERASDQLPSE